ncbi:zinc ribbon domain-containing protein [Anaerotignum lactatifermentans]|uniref:zinc ribbon domain-containing protein n=1 Tax=Anaerotignum lactatifermentans TaxID=160404 RepID=UPI003AB1E182
MHCPYCNHKISAHANFCEQCGKKIPKCPTCGHIILKRENFCPVDGTPFPPEFFADWPMEEASLSEKTTLPEETALPEPDLQELSYSTAEPIESDVIDDEDFEEEYDEEYDDFEDFEDYDESEESEKTNWKPILIAAAIVGVICIFISYIAIVTGPGTLKTEENTQVEAPAKQQDTQEADTAVFLQYSDDLFLMPQDDVII